MPRPWMLVAAALVWIGLSAAPAPGQPYGSRTAPIPPGPTVSPYLNLTRPGGVPAINYYGLVRPQFDTYAGLRVLRQGILQSQLVGTAVTDLDAVPTTGRPAGFMTHGGYFMTTGGQAAVRGPAAIRVSVGSGGPTPTRSSGPAFR